MCMLKFCLLMSSLVIISFLEIFLFLKGFCSIKYVVLSFLFFIYYNCMAVVIYLYVMKWPEDGLILIKTCFHII